VVLSGAATEAQLRSNVRALHVTLDEEARTTLAALAEPPEMYWETRKSLAWN
jgi:aryl-alcohol dehydrogenase-like predicted oxidoreductase